MAHPDDMGTRIVQLAVDRHGHLAGNYFDMITDAENSVVGEINRQTQRAEWSPNRNPDVRFRASIYRLLQPYGLRDRAASRRRTTLAIRAAGELTVTGLKPLAHRDM